MSCVSALSLLCVQCLTCKLNILILWHAMVEMALWQNLNSILVFCQAVRKQEKLQHCQNMNRQGLTGKLGFSQREEQVHCCAGWKWLLWTPLLHVTFNLMHSYASSILLFKNWWVLFKLPRTMYAVCQLDCIQKWVGNQKDGFPMMLWSLEAFTPLQEESAKLVVLDLERLIGILDGRRWPCFR